MSARIRRRERGYALIEAMVGGAVAMLAMGGLLAGLSQASAHLGRSVATQTATQLLLENVERLRLLPLTDPAWDVNPHPCLSALPDPATWQCGITVVLVADPLADPSGGTLPLLGTLNYRRATITVTHGGVTWQQETMKW